MGKNGFPISIGQRIGKFLITTLWGIAILMMLALILEIFLKIRGDPRQRQLQKSMPEYTRLYNAYYPFCVQHINPFYLFFFPFNAEGRLAINSDICSVDAHGFRGPGPAEAGKRKLAFILGGSAAFGHYSSSNDTTISGYLNRMQSQYFFVNAGVPSWNSFQELIRLSQQILDFSPALVVAYDGNNDVALAFDYWEKGLDYPVGTPKSFDALSALVGDIRGDRLYQANKPIYERFFPLLTKGFEYHVLGKRLGDPKMRGQRPNQSPPDTLMFKAADRYLENLVQMEVLTKAHGAHFVAIFQPLGRLHHSSPESEKTSPKTTSYRVFRDRVFSQTTKLSKYLDYSTLFNCFPKEVIWLGRPGHKDMDDEVVFVDYTHLSDRGNRFVAERIAENLIENSYLAK